MAVGRRHSSSAASYMQSVRLQRSNNSTRWRSWVRTVGVRVAAADAEPLGVPLDVVVVQFDPQRPAEVRLPHRVLQPPPGVGEPVGHLCGRHRVEEAGSASEGPDRGFSPAPVSCVNPGPAGPSRSWWGRGCPGVCTASVSVVGPCPGAPVSCGEL